MIVDRRKKQLSKFAHHISNEFCSGNVSLLEEMASSEDISIYFDHYEDSFDGMLLYDDKNFHIHINKDKGNIENSKRGRYTLAHELGHYFIDEHRVGLKQGLLQPHGSIHNINRKEVIEYEADYFASCLLMPEERFRKQSGGKKFSLDVIKNLSDSFQSSVLSTVLKFTEIGTHEITVVVSEKNNVKWFAQSKDFPKWPFKFRVGQSLPPTTVAGEFFKKIDSKYTDIQEVSPDDWFYPKDARGNRVMREQCYYSDSYGYVISLIWFD